MPALLQASTAFDAIVAAEGDIKLAAERLEVAPVALRQSALDHIVGAGVADRVRALMLLNLLEILGELRLNILAQMPEFSPMESLKALELVTVSLTALSAPPPAPPAPSLTVVGGNDIIDRLASKLMVYNRPTPTLPEPIDA